MGGNLGTHLMDDSFVQLTKNDYELLAAQIESLAEADANWLPVLANASALIMDTLEGLNWAGFYLVDQKTKDTAPELRLGPFQGKVACVRIPFGKGVCGAAAQQDAPQLVPDVHAFPGHIACDSASRSEIVIPLHASGKVIGVLDIDSPYLARFSEIDLAGLSSVVRALEKCIAW